jgi:hypothetical protein
VKRQERVGESYFIHASPKKEIGEVGREVRREGWRIGRELSLSQYLVFNFSVYFL